MVKMFFIMLGAIFSLLVVSVGAVCGLNSYNDHKRTLDSLDYVHQVLPKILTGWNYQYLVSNASPVLLGMVKDSDLQDFFESSLHEYGAYKSCDNENEVVPFLIAPSDQDIIAEYYVTCNFVNKSAKIHLALLKDGGKWYMNAINVAPSDTCASKTTAESNSLVR